MKAKVHAFAGVLALLMVSGFWSATALSELLGDASTIAAVKNGILAGMLVMVPAMAVAGASGFSLGKGWRSPVVNRKKQRMKIIAANGILILLPSAVFLANRAGAGEFGAAFVAVQAVELAAGAVNIALLSMNMRDGFASRRKPSRPRADRTRIA